jgi:cell division protein FtsI (penicillin-binding protein 3)
VAGKTGTAKIVSGGAYRRDYNASFVGYFPADNPKYSCIVSINKPTVGGYYGGSVAAPAFREISDKVFSTSLVLDLDYETNFEVANKPGNYHPAYSDDLKEIYTALNVKPIDYLSNDPWAIATATNDSIEFESVEFPTAVVPNVKGMKARDAVYLLENLGMNTSLAGRGAVRSQSIKAGSPIKKGQKIKLQLAVY